MANLRDSLDTIQQKARERTVKTQNVEYDLDTLIKRIDKGAIKLDPEYQRRHRWPEETSSRLIESLILNIPIPVIFLSQDVDVDDEVDASVARYTVIDGQQRLTAIHKFMKNKLRLEGLEGLEELNGSYYKDLPPFLERRLEERTIKCLRIDSTVDPQVKFDIFERLNTGSVKLESQELRNATARGPFNNAIKKWAAKPYFRTLLQIDPNRPEDSIKVRKMEDVELVLRFFALKDGRYKNLRKGFRDFITGSLIDFNELHGPEIESMGETFATYMTFLLEEAGRDAFSKWRVTEGGPKRMSSFNAAVYDAVAVGLSEVFTDQDIQNRRGEVCSALSGYRSLFADDEFFSAVSGSVNDAAKVKTRIEKMVTYLRR
ncbi:DUF262 domain-containing protein [Alteriqipengyuania sp. NZ-12B]|uniref:DUF262 domain-containing protein n=1 Tax=Alteriqipengyuania abyssalis TaxID=2860200 RepID=A0ABS7PGS5_9SPHN|nr:DUF262 domain-containing protein [Alteriqipengyuania abyssalis]MBY8338151.1 DUF262 domain-containing protein [Alteriqipengyuania abyssalis]